MKKYLFWISYILFIVFQDLRFFVAVRSELLLHFRFSHQGVECAGLQLFFLPEALVLSFVRFVSSASRFSSCLWALRSGLHEAGYLLLLVFFFANCAAIFVWRRPCFSTGPIGFSCRSWLLALDFGSACWSILAVRSHRLSELHDLCFDFLRCRSPCAPEISIPCPRARSAG
jgi:hypothetical protein